MPLYSTTIETPVNKQAFADTCIQLMKYIIIVLHRGIGECTFNCCITLREEQKIERELEVGKTYKSNASRHCRIISIMKAFETGKPKCGSKNRANN